MTDTLPQAGSLTPDQEVDLGLLERALAKLQEALSALAAEPGNEYVRDSVVKRFEFTYELAVKTLMRYLRSVALSAGEIEDLTFQGIIRRGDKVGLLGNGWPEWKAYREARNLTAHTYNEETARSVILTAESFAKEASALLDNLGRRMANHG